MEYFFFDKNDLFDKDSSLSLGWFVISDVEVVKETKCILLIALSDLSYGLLQLKNKKKGNYSWYPCDSGEKIVFQKQKESLQMCYNDSMIDLDFNDFEDSLMNLLRRITNELYASRNEVEKETAFKDIIMFLKENS